MSVLGVFLCILLTLSGIFLILLVLVQRGRGGGLAGALGGMGGQSAFGTKAGDLFTRITIVVAAVWILLCVATLKLLGTPTERLGTDLGGDAPINVSEKVDPAGGGAGAGTPSGSKGEEAPE